MLKNDIKVAFRTLIKQKSTSFINIACLTIGISACLLLLLWGQNEDLQRVYIFSAMAFLILLAACLNYIHLATAKFSKRSKETALRKALGASNRKLIAEFLSESFLHTFIALMLSLFMAESFLPFFNSFPGKPLSFAAFNNGTFIITITGIVILVGLFSGIGAALFMIKLNPAPVLKNVYKHNSFFPGFRKFLVVFQFAIAIIFFICTSIISDQFVYLRARNLELDKGNIDMAVIFFLITLLQVILSCLGIFGLIVFNAEKRSRELGIRKVLGSSARELNILLLKELMLWIFAANVLAWPIAWYLMTQWLQEFAYRIRISPRHFFFAGIMVFIIAIMTVIYKAFKAASTDPAVSLKE